VQRPSFSKTPSVCQKICGTIITDDEEQTLVFDFTGHRTSEALEHVLRDLLSPEDAHEKLVPYLVQDPLLLWDIVDTALQQEVPVPEKLPGYADVWMCESCHEEEGMPPHPSKWYRVQTCFKKCGKRSKCKGCEADKDAGDSFRVAMQDQRRKLPTSEAELKKAGDTYKSKWFILQEGYAASQSDPSSPTAKLTSSYLYPQVRRDGQFFGYGYADAHRVEVLVTPTTLDLAWSFTVT
jgi:hypothetical protein